MANLTSSGYPYLSQYSLMSFNHPISSCEGSIAANRASVMRARLLFRTCLKNSITGENSHHISGLYEVDQELSAIHPDYNSPCIRARSLHFTSIEDSVKIGYFYNKEPNPRFRFPFHSETNDGVYFDDLKAWTSQILSSDNLTQEYISETTSLNDVYLQNEFSQDQYYSECKDCESHEKCPLEKRIDTKHKVRYYIGKLEAERISVNINL